MKDLPAISLPELIQQEAGATGGAPHWQQALAARDPKLLLGISVYHLAAFPRLVSYFADLKRELRFSDLGQCAQSAFVSEILERLRDEGETVASGHCRRIIHLLQDEYVRRRATNAVSA